MKNKKIIDVLQSDLAWLDELVQVNDDLDISEPIYKSGSKGSQQINNIEIGGQILSLSRVPSVNCIAGHKETSRKMKGVQKSESHKAAIRAAAAKRRGHPNGRKGIPHSELHKQRIGDSNRGVSRTTVWKGRKHSDETKEKLRQHNLNRDPGPYRHSAEKIVEIGNSISAGKKGKKRSPEMIAKMAEQRAMNFKTPIGVFRDRSKAEKAYFELGHSKQDFKKLYMHQPDKFFFTTKAISV